MEAMSGDPFYKYFVSSCACLSPVTYGSGPCPNFLDTCSLSSDRHDAKRCYFLAEWLTSLVSLPASAYETAQWPDVFPHVS